MHGYDIGGLNWLTLPRMTINKERTFKLPSLPSVRCVLLSARPLPHDHPLIVLFGAKGSSAHYDRVNQTLRNSTWHTTAVIVIYVHDVIYRCYHHHLYSIFMVVVILLIWNRLTNLFWYDTLLPSSCIVFNTAFICMVMNEHRQDGLLKLVYQ